MKNAVLETELWFRIWTKKGTVVPFNGTVVPFNGTVVPFLHCGLNP